MSIPKYSPFYLVQVIMLLFELYYGVRSSVVNFLFWTGLVIYGVFKLRSYIFIAMDLGEVSIV